MQSSTVIRPLNRPSLCWCSWAVQGAGWMPAYHAAASGCFMAIGTTPTGSSADVRGVKHDVLFFYPDTASPWLQNDRLTVKEEEPSVDPPNTRDCTLTSKRGALPCSWSFALGQLHWFQFPVLISALWVEKCAPKHSDGHSLYCW